jgi:hypothetical protein
MTPQGNGPKFLKKSWFPKANSDYGTFFSTFHCEMLHNMNEKLHDE